MKYLASYLNYLVIITLLVASSPAFCETENYFLLDWEDALIGDDLPLEFRQTVTTLFPLKETVSIDHVRRWSPTHWQVTRESFIHGELVFGSSSSGSWAIANESNIMYESPEQVVLCGLLNPLSLGSLSMPPRVISREESGEEPFWVAERVFRDGSTSRFWIDLQKRHLIREEFRDEEGNVLYILKRADFKPIGISDVEEKHMAAKQRASRIFDNQQEWWHHVLIKHLQQEQPDILLPRKLPEGMLMIAAIKGEDGTNQIRYSNGTQVISVFQRQSRGRFREHFEDNADFAVFVTERQGKMIIIIGPFI